MQTRSFLICAEAELRIRKMVLSSDMFPERDRPYYVGRTDVDIERVYVNFAGKPKHLEILAAYIRGINDVMFGYVGNVRAKPFL